MRRTFLLFISLPVCGVLLEQAEQSKTRSFSNPGSTTLYASNKVSEPGKGFREHPVAGGGWHLGGGVDAPCPILHTTSYAPLPPDVHLCPLSRPSLCNTLLSVSVSLRSVSSSSKRWSPGRERRAPGCRARRSDVQVAPGDLRLAPEVGAVLWDRAPHLRHLGQLQSESELN